MTKYTEEAKALVRRQYAGDPETRDRVLAHMEANTPEADAALVDSLNDRETRVRTLIEQTGITRGEAEHRVDYAAGRLAPEDMTRAELQDNIDRQQATVAAAEQAAEQAAEDERRAAITAEAERWEAANPGDIDIERSQRKAAERRKEAEWARKTDEAFTEQKARNPHIPDETLRHWAENDIAAQRQREGDHPAPPSISQQWSEAADAFRADQ